MQPRAVRGEIAWRPTISMPFSTRRSSGDWAAHPHCVYRRRRCETETREPAWREKKRRVKE
eukprot:2045193-Prymnesium_polylepis.1